MPKFGVVVDEEMAELIDEPLEYGDSRSKRIRNLAKVGLEVEHILQTRGVVTNDPEERASIVSDALTEYLEGDTEG